MADNKTDRKAEVERRLMEFSRQSDADVLKALDTDEDGLNQVQAADRLEEYGPNIIDTGNENSLLKRIREAVINPFNLVLLAVAAVTLVTDVIIAEERRL